MQTALALVRQGRSFQEASDVTGIPAEEIMVGHYSVREPDRPFPDNDDAPG